ncbi:phosphatidylinositol-3,5-bisphosphate 3-phosphatase MTMR14 isoform X2 [Periplaneta americana]|uniref:phosphatidylinositol-3,5-bisphosphate 3-phosphatase MTMR14 isoform X2 n=1 Tax=Periplaneta americana TaxID=6978 RepID=UPI0037E75A1B
MEEINQEDIQQLLEHFSKCLYRAKEADAKCQDVMQRCLKLVALDYSHVVINNTSGELSANYPSHLIILEYERPSGNVNGSMRSTEPPRTTSTIYENMHDPSRLRELFMRSRFARCRARFPLPVILYRGKHICRSSTLSGGPEIYGRSGLDYLFSAAEPNGEDDEEEVMGASQTQRDWQLFDRVRSQDIRLLKTLNVGTIIDFMVEKKKVKFGMNVTSSEKVDKENRYSDFNIVSLPYPGCEFFKEYRDNDYVARGLVFDWSQSHVDAVIGVPDDIVSSQLKIDWEKYKVWDLVKLTQNYLKLMLRYLHENSTGLLVHCISGWDRTPLFISLLRISLWADGAVHQSLSASQILYYTIAYDWMLFGHNLMDRLSKGEDIFFFCFYFLKHIVSDEYSVSPRPKVKQQTSGSAGNVSSGCGASSGAVGGASSSAVTGPSSAAVTGPSSAAVTGPSSAAIGSASSGAVGGAAGGYIGSASGGGGSSSGSSSLGSFTTVLRNDPDLQLDGMLFDADCAISSRGSNISLNSSCSSVSSKSQDNPPVLFHNVLDISDEHTNGNFPFYNSQTTWPPHLQSSVVESSPPLPGLGAVGAQPGSRSPHPSRTSPVAVPVSSRLRQRNDSNSSLSVGSWQMISGTGSLRGSASNSTGDSSAPNSQNNSNNDMRRDRLHTIRTLFYNSYCSTIGFKFKNGQDSGLGSLLGNFAEKVGIISTQRTSV